MIFVGDVAIASSDHFKHESFPSSFLDVPICLNLEGAVSESMVLPKRGLVNHSAWLQSFEGLQLGPVFIGNNHIQDIPNGITRTKRFLASVSLKSFGAGESMADAEAWAIEGEHILLGFGWPVIGCIPASRSRGGVNRLEGQSVVRQVTAALKKHSDKKIVVIFHGNYEFELYPQPGHRALALSLIDLGVYAVIGHHPHIVGPVERYKGRTIAYSLGNWAFSYGRLFEGRLRFPKSSFNQIAVQLTGEADLVHHVKYSPPEQIVYQNTESVIDSVFSLCPPFED